MKQFYDGANGGGHGIDREQIPKSVSAIVDNHRGPIHWPGSPSGFPFRGETVPSFKQDEIDHLAHVADAHHFRFELWLEAHREAFDIICERIANGTYRVIKRLEQWVNLPTKIRMDDGSEVSREMPYLVVHMEWAQIYAELPSGKQIRG